MSKLVSFFKDESGATAIEYGLIAGLNTGQNFQNSHQMAPAFSSGARPRMIDVG